METNFVMLRKLIKDFKPQRRGFLYANEIELISATLHLNEMDLLALRNLRDFTVMFLSSFSGYEEDCDYSDISSGIVAVIDKQIISLGGTV